jgi:protein ImuB
MLWWALHLPALSLEAFVATLPPEQAVRPAALVAAHRVAVVNAEAAACGVRVGMKRATALALASELLLAEAQAARDATALRAVAHTALAFTPAVTLQDGQTVLMEVQGSLRLFGGPAGLQQRLVAALAPLGHRVQMAAAPTAVAAGLLARWWPQPDGANAAASEGAAAASLLHGPHSTDLAALQALLDQAPVWLLGPGREHWEALQGMGLHTLHDLQQLPRAGLARRFGTEVLDELDRARGRRADPRRWLTLPTVFESRLELFARAETTDQVLHGAGVLLARLLAWAQARQARVGGFTLRMRHERQRQVLQPPTELAVALAEPSAELGHLQLLLRERLARVVLTAPTLELQLHCQQLVAGEAPNGELFPTHAGQAEGLVRLLERLRARLGDDQVQALQPVADHRPECATRAVPARGGARADAEAGDAAARGAAAALAHGLLPLHRPTWLLPQPQPLSERDAVPWLQGQPLQLLSGPERIETGWWDGEPATRDYYIAQTREGALLWLWHTRLPSADETAPRWFLQGRFG